MAFLDFLSRGKDEKTKKEATEALKKKRRESLGIKGSKKTLSAIEKRKLALADAAGDN